MGTILGLRSTGPGDIAITATTVITTGIIGNQMTPSSWLDYLVRANSSFLWQAQMGCCRRPVARQ
jgi:hypothetical protein